MIDRGPTWDERTQEELPSAVERELRRALEAAAERARAAGVPSGETLASGEAVAQILDEADTWNATCVVAGTHGRHGVSHAVLGSCAEALVRRSARPVLIARTSPAQQTALERILCAFDGSAAARQAFEAAATLAENGGAELHLLTVVQLDDLYARIRARQLRPGRLDRRAVRRGAPRDQRTGRRRSRRAACASRRTSWAARTSRR